MLELLSFPKELTDSEAYMAQKIVDMMDKLTTAEAALTYYARRLWRSDTGRRAREALERIHK